MPANTPIVGQRVDFGRAPAARAADRVVEGPLLRQRRSVQSHYVVKRV